MPSDEPSGDERALAALAAISPDLAREDWVRVGMALHSAGFPFEVFDTWSARGATYTSAAAQAVWRSFKSDSGVGLGTLFHLASQHGWRTAAADSRAPDGPAAIWARCHPATAQHPYIAQKHGLPDGLRVLPQDDELVMAGVSMAGALVVPAYAPDGSLKTLQLIAPPPGAAQLRALHRPTKLNLKGHSFGDAWFAVGALMANSSATIYVCEGIGQAWACNRATDHPAVVCFGAGRLGTVATALKQQYPQASLVVVADAGAEAPAERAARVAGARLVTMPSDWAKNSDVNDVLVRDGPEAVAHLLATGRAVPGEGARFKLLKAEQLHAMADLPWLVHGVLPARGIAALFGPSTAGKSFLALDLCCAVADGQRWFDHAVTPAPVVYIALEGQMGIKQRVQAWEAHHHRPAPARLHVLLEPFNITNPDDVADLAAVIPQGALVVVDTLSRAAPGADENSSRDMSAIIDGATTLQAQIGGAVVLVHHSGKDPTKGLRGHSSLLAAVDAAIEVSRSADGRQRNWMLRKAKDGEDGTRHGFALAGLQVDDSVTSCAVQAQGAVNRPLRLPQGHNQRAVFAALKPLFAQGVVGALGSPAAARCIKVEGAVLAGAEALDCEPSRRSTRAKEALNGLIERGILACSPSGWLWETDSHQT